MRPEVNNRLLRLVAAVLTIGTCIVVANYYMDLGWFGRYAKVVLNAALLLVCIFLMVMRRLWKGALE